MTVPLVPLLGAAHVRGPPHSSSPPGGLSGRTHRPTFKRNGAFFDLTRIHFLRPCQFHPTHRRARLDDNWNESFEQIGIFDYDGISKAFELDPHQSPDDMIKRFCQIEPSKYPSLIDWLESQEKMV
jgi:hypothetical protein